MGDVWIQVFTRNVRDREVLTRAVGRKMAEEDAVGAEVLIAREPAHIDLRNDAAMIYRELGRPDRALVHFAAVAALAPRSPAAHYNAGVALEALGRDAEAAGEYERAADLDAAYAPARFASANLLYRRRQLAEAIAEYRAGLRAAPGNVLARCSLARALTETGQPLDAVTEYQAALGRLPDSVPCLINAAWLLSAHRDPAVRRPGQAVQYAERAVTLTGHGSAEALDAVAAAYAAAGRFDDAVRAGSEALRLAESTPGAALAAEIRARLDLYRRHDSFFVP
jgi:tetratricopeptide (TPR) repeat protein